MRVGAASVTFRRGGRRDRAKSQVFGFRVSRLWVEWPSVSAGTVQPLRRGRVRKAPVARVSRGPDPVRG